MFQILQQSDYKLHFVTFGNNPVNEHPRDEKGLSFTSSKRSTFQNSEIMTMTVTPPPPKKKKIWCLVWTEQQI